jgi:hypothetical protein
LSNTSLPVMLRLRAAWRIQASVGLGVMPAR